MLGTSASKTYVRSVLDLIILIGIDMLTRNGWRIGRVLLPALSSHLLRTCTCCGFVIIMTMRQLVQRGPLQSCKLEVHELRYRVLYNSYQLIYVCTYIHICTYVYSVDIHSSERQMRSLAKALSLVWPTTRHSSGGALRNEWRQELRKS